jgi:hypothetical protein
MIKFVLMFTSSIALLSAVNWQEEQITSSTDTNSYMPILVLDSESKPSIVFTRGTTQGPYTLNIISEAEPEWIIREIAQIPQGSTVYFSADFSSDDHLFVAFSTRFGSQCDLYLASDTSGVFETTNLTDDAFNQYLPIIKVGTDDVVRMVYKEENDIGYNIRYAWLEGDSLHSESIKDTMLVDPFDFDFILDNDNNPHVFFTDDDTLRYASRISANNWSITQLGVCGGAPSAVLGPSGKFYVVYIDLGKLWVLSNPGGVWGSEDVTSAPLMYNYEYPAIALDNEENPHLVWHRWEAPCQSYPDFMNEIFYSGKTNGIWSEPDSMPPIGKGKSFGLVHPFRIDKKGFGHVTYMAWLEGPSQIFYAKTQEPLSVGITETAPRPPQAPSLEIKGSSVCFNLPQASFIRIALYDASGRRVRELAQGFYPSGPSEVTLSRNNLSSGVYFARLESNGSSANARMVVIK